MFLWDYFRRVVIVYIYEDGETYGPGVGHITAIAGLATRCNSGTRGRELDQGVDEEHCWMDFLGVGGDRIQHLRRSSSVRAEHFASPQHIRDLRGR